MGRRVENILFIMFDQLRFDYLSCAGHPFLETPHIDALAAKGVRFDRAYVQSTICGSSRMSFYTGRYVHSHGACWNNVPLRVGEITLGDHLREVGMDCWLVGKTHMKADAEGMARLGLEPDSVIGARVAECGFDLFERDDGMRPEGPAGFYDPKGALAYNAYLRNKGYESDNPWHDFANSGLDEAGDVASGWFLKNAAMPANIAEEDSETPYLTRRAVDFMGEAKAPWLCHLSYIKPHWPYIVSAPYHAMYGHNQIMAPVRSDSEWDDVHPVQEVFMSSPIGTSFSRDLVREAVIPAYMGLVKQCDDCLGRLFAWMEETGRMETTMIVVTSDHGDYLGDHWMGEKMFFHDQSVRVPLIIYDPSPEADGTRGMVSHALVEAIDLAPTFVEAAGGKAGSHVLEGCSLLPILRGAAQETGRNFVISEYDYSLSPAAGRLGISPEDARLFMIADRRWKMIHSEGGFRPILFDLENDPSELDDLARRPGHEAVIDQLLAKLGTWARRPSQQTTLSVERRAAMQAAPRSTGVIIGAYDETDVPPELTVKYRGRRVPRRG
ncbi:MAG: sulfatase-like hydrolase/transferase [Geminicoccaceae bacterium]